jgi:hypothetical protein
MSRRCAFVSSDGRPCGAAPLREGAYCFLHDPDRAEDAAEARRLGGLRRRREGTLGMIYDLTTLDSVDGIRRLLDIVVADGLGLENGIGRLRVLIAAATAALKILEVGDLEARIEALESLQRTRSSGVRRAGVEQDLLGLHA